MSDEEGKYLEANSDITAHLEVYGEEGSMPLTPEEEERYVNDPEHRREARLMYPEDTGCTFKMFIILDSKIVDYLRNKGYEVKKRHMNWYDVNIPIKYGEMIMFNDLVLYSLGTLLVDEDVRVEGKLEGYLSRFGWKL